jgi:tRNA A-37 threonylcarbamoyl transferase component Bud32
VTGYSILHLVLAGVCGLLALVHFALYAIVPRDKVQRSIALTFVGFMMVNLGIAGSGIRAAGSLGDPRPWLVVGILAVVPLWVGLLMTAWRMVEAPMTRDRKGLLLAAIAMAVVRLSDVGIFLSAAFRTGQIVTWERVFDSLATITVLPAWGMTILVGGTCVVEAWRDLGKKSLAAWVLLGTSLPSTILCLREVLVTVGLLHGATWLGLTGLPFLFTASGIVAMRYAHAMREQNKEGEVSGYKLLRRLEAGGMGELFLAARVGPAGFERHVALKRMLLRDQETGTQQVDPRDEEELTNRFLAEARMAAGLSHPNIIGVHDLGRLDGGWFIAMEYVAGISVGQLRDRSRAANVALPIELALVVGEQVAAGLSFAHGRGIIHRDISPQNLMIPFDGPVKIIDFGIAVEVGKQRTTGAGLVVGKGAYMSPERVSGKPGEPPSDVFALGIVLYEMLVGQRPFHGADKTALARSIQTGMYPAIGDLRPEVPPSIVTLVDRALERDPERRISAADFGIQCGELRQRLTPFSAGRFARELCNDDFKAQRRVAVFAGLSTPMPGSGPTRQASAADR